jgi:hypothetical protein
MQSPLPERNRTGLEPESTFLGYPRTLGAKKTRSASGNRKQTPLMVFALSPHAPFVSHWSAWEAKTKARRKLRRRRSPNPNRSPAVNAKGSPQLRPSKRGIGCLRSRVAFKKTQQGPPCLWRAFLRLVGFAAMLGRLRSGNNAFYGMLAQLQTYS